MPKLPGVLGYEPAYSTYDINAGILNARDRKLPVRPSFFSGIVPQVSAQDAAMNRPEPVERASLFPLATYPDGSTRLALPGMIAEDIPRAFTAPARAYRGEIADEDMIAEGLNFGGTMAMGGSVVPKGASAVARVAANATESAAPGVIVSEAARAPRPVQMEVPFFRGSGHAQTSVDYSKPYWGTTDRSTADFYARSMAQAEGATPNVTPAVARFRNPMLVDAQGAGFSEIPFDGKRWSTDDLAAAAKERGHDGLVIDRLYDGGRWNPDEGLPATVAALGPGTVSSAFDPNTILYANSRSSSAPGVLAAEAADLPMDTASRLARAREMGFDTDTRLYHGTQKAFDEFNPGTNGYGERRNVYLTDTPEIADIYANSDRRGKGNPAVYPVYAKAEKPLTVSDKGPDGSFGWITDNLANALGVDRDKFRRGGLYDEARRQGYDLVRIEDMMDLGGPQTQYIPLDPRNIRSVNAAFDPAKADSANLLAANKDAAVPGVIAAEAADKPRGIRAYHGSPHDFDRFDLSKIGTGEGAQAFGHGLYFAENEGVAKSYRDGLGGWKWNGAESIPSRMVGEFDVAHDVRQALNYANGDPKRAREVLEREVKAGLPGREDMDKAALALFDEIAPNLEPKANGKMYEVNINANPDDFLDWDKPLSQQSEKVREGTRQALIDRGIQKSVADYVASSERPARDAMSALARGEYNTRLNVPDGELAADASKRLRKLGIPGIRYLDQGSRWTGDPPDKIRADLQRAQQMLYESDNKKYWRDVIAAHEKNLMEATKAQTHNYVVFDDALIEILRKYMNPPTAAAPGVLMYEGAKDARQ